MCFKVSSVQRQLNLLEWSDFVHVPLAIRISFLACFIFLCTGFLLVTFWISSDCLFFIYFFFCSSPGLKCDLSTSGLSQFVLSFWCYTYLVGGRLKIPLCFRNFNFMAFFFLLKEKKKRRGGWFWVQILFNANFCWWILHRYFCQIPSSCHLKWDVRR